MIPKDVLHLILNRVDNHTFCVLLETSRKFHIYTNQELLDRISSTKSLLEHIKNNNIEGVAYHLRRGNRGIEELMEEQIDVLAHVIENDLVDIFKLMYEKYSEKVNIKLFKVCFIAFSIVDVSFISIFCNGSINILTYLYLEENQISNEYVEHFCDYHLSDEEEQIIIDICKNKNSKRLETISSNKLKGYIKFLYNSVYNLKFDYRSSISYINRNLIF